MIKSTEYTELGNVTKKHEYEEIGWSVFDASMIYRRKTTLFSIADGVITVYFEFTDKEGKKYKANVYKNFYNGLTYI